MSVEYAIIIKNKTRLETLVERFNTKQQAKFYIERSGGKFEDYELEHERFFAALASVQQQLSKVIKNKIVERAFLPSFLFNEKQIALVIGQDGLVANAAKYVNGIPIVAINPDIERYDGVLLPFTPNDFTLAVEKVVKNKFEVRSTPFAEARLNDGQRLLAFNDLFIGASSHVSARYKISYQDSAEEHSSSGIIVSTQSGVTGWMSSIFNMAAGLHEFIAGVPTKKKYIKLKADQLVFVVREPFASKKTQTSIQAGIVSERANLVVESLMPANGVIFSDGIESDFLRFNSGSRATIGIAKEKANLVRK